MQLQKYYGLIFFMVPTQQRFALEDLKDNGHFIKKSQVVLLPLGSTHRNAEYFSLPDEFDVLRDQVACLAWGRIIAWGHRGSCTGEAAYHTLIGLFPMYETVS